MKNHIGITIMRQALLASVICCFSCNNENAPRLDGENRRELRTALRLDGENRRELRTAPRLDGENRRELRTAPRLDGENRRELRTAPRLAGENRKELRTAPRLDGENRRELRTALRLAGENRGELEAVLEHYSGEPEKLAAARFLIRNMPAHYSYRYADSIDIYYKVAEQVLKDTTLSVVEQKDSLLHFRQDSLPGLEKHIVSDVEICSAEFLIHNIDHAFNEWKTRPWARHVSFDEFCEWLLPYKVAELQSMDSWRDTLSTHFSDKIPDIIKDDVEYNTAYRTLDAVRNTLLDKVKPHGIYTDAGYPLLTAELLHRQTYGRCLDYVNLGVLTYRSLGLPAVVDETPYWGRYRAGHTWYTMLGDRGQELPSEWDLGSVPGWSFFPYERIPKVWRRTWAINPRILEYRKKSRHPYPFELCRKDVSYKYMETKNIEIQLLDDARPDDRYCLIAVFNGHKEPWSPVDFGRVRHGKAEFQAMGRNILYIAMTYDGFRLTPVSEPFILEPDGSIRTISIDEEKTISIDVKRKYFQNANVATMRQRLIGGRIQCADRADFTDAETILNIDSVFTPTMMQVKAASPHRYWRWLGADGSHGSLAELQFFRTDSTQISGSAITCKNASEEIAAKAFDGDMLTNFETDAENDAWVGLELEKPETIGYVSVFPRSDDNDICPGDEYEVKYWSSGMWVMHETVTATSNRLHLEGIPAGALIWISDKTRGWDERPFLVNSDGSILWL